MALTPFESIKMLTETKTPHTSDQLREFSSWMVTRGFSMDKTTILFADMVNRTGLSNLQVHDWFFSALPKKKFYAKWSKASKADEQLKMVQARYKCNKNQALEYLSLMSPQEIKALEADMDVGGAETKKSKSPKS